MIHMHEVRKLSREIAAELDMPQGESYVEIKLNGEHLEQFKEILSRGLNTAPPEKWADWIKISDALSNIKTTDS